MRAGHLPWQASWGLYQVLHDGIATRGDILWQPAFCFRDVRCGTERQGGSRRARLGLHKLSRQM